jgi:hypothetical protein
VIENSALMLHPVLLPGFFQIAIMKHASASIIPVTHQGFNLLFTRLSEKVTLYLFIILFIFFLVFDVWITWFKAKLKYKSEWLWRHKLWMSDTPIPISKTITCKLSNPMIPEYSNTNIATLALQFVNMRIKVTALTIVKIL